MLRWMPTHVVLVAIIIFIEDGLALCYVSCVVSAVMNSERPEAMMYTYIKACTCDTTTMVMSWLKNVHVTMDTSAPGMVDWWDLQHGHDIQNPRCCVCICLVSSY